MVIEWMVQDIVMLVELLWTLPMIRWLSIDLYLLKMMIYIIIKMFHWKFKHYQKNSQSMNNENKWIDSNVLVAVHQHRLNSIMYVYMHHNVIQNKVINSIRRKIAKKTGSIIFMMKRQEKRLIHSEGKNVCKYVWP